MRLRADPTERPGYGGVRFAFMSAGEGRYVLRFAPFTTEGIERNIQRQVDGDRAKRRPPRWGVSAFAEAPRDDETLEQMLARVCQEAPVGGKNVAVIPEEELLAHGLVAHIDVPPPHHVLIGDPDLSESTDLTQLAGIWSDRKVRNPAWENGA